MPQVFAYVVAYNSAPYIEKCVSALLGQAHFEIGKSLFVHVTDNASKDQSAQIIEQHFSSRVVLTRNSNNLGFCGAHNQGAALFLKSAAKYFLIVNADLRLEEHALAEMVKALESDSTLGSVCAKLYRSDDELNSIEPRTLDSSGMFMTPALRHFDRGSNAPDSEEYSRDCLVFGGTGACLLMRREFVESVALPAFSRDDCLFTLYPQLKEGFSERVQLFDEAFFAYREDAELAWRAQRQGWKCRYVASAVGYHKRVVVPERRAELPVLLNKLGVRNRFLMQLSHLELGPLFSARYWPILSMGFMLRNGIVIVAVFIKEQGSLSAFFELWKLLPRALELRALLASRARVPASEVLRWFKDKPYTE